MCECASCDHILARKKENQAGHAPGAGYRAWKCTGAIWWLILSVHAPPNPGSSVRPPDALEGVLRVVQEDDFLLALHGQSETLF